MMVKYPGTFHPGIKYYKDDQFIRRSMRPSFDERDRRKDNNKMCNDDNDEDFESTKNEKRLLLS